MKGMRTAALLATLAALGACKQDLAPAATAPTATISAADADKIADATVAAWTSMEAGRIKALYAPGIVGFDFMTAPLVADRATWDKKQEGYAAAKMDVAEVKERKVQPLTADIFVMSGRWKLSSRANPKHNAVIRCTDVFHRDTEGNWPIVNEHCSTEPAATPA